MPKYTKIFEAAASRAVSQGIIDVEAFVAILVESGMSREALADALTFDLENNGPIFGRFIRSIGGAVEASVVGAVTQGEFVGHIASDKELERLTRLAGERGTLVDAIDYADAEAAQRLEDEILAEERYTWVAELINTCHRCLPLHGQTHPLSWYKANGLMPAVMHTGWASSCHCRLVPAVIGEDRAELMAPLKRVKEKGSRKTKRAVSAMDDAAGIAARDSVLNSMSKDSQRIMRLLGQSDRKAVDDE